MSRTQAATGWLVGLMLLAHAAALLRAASAATPTATRTATRTAPPTAAPRTSTATPTVNQSIPMVAVDDFPGYRVFQCDLGGTSKSVTVSGTYSNMNWSRIEARLLRHGTNTAVLDWATIDSTPGGGAFSGNLIVPQGGWYDVEIRALHGSGSVIGSSRGTNKWGVGMIVLVIGQSNMSGNGRPPFTAATADLAVNYSNAGRWEHLADPYDDESPAGAVDNDNDVISSWNVGGSMIPAIATALLQTFDFPVAFVPAAKGGSNLYVNAYDRGWAYRNPSNHFDTSTLYGQSITRAQSVGGVELIIMHQGESDLSDGRTEASYEADFAPMIGNYRQDLHSGIPIFTCQLGTVGAGTDAGVVGIRNAQHDVDNGTNVFMGATAMDLPRFDTWHYDTPELTVIGTRVANAIKYYLGQSLYYRGPSVDSAFFSDGDCNQVIVRLNHRGGTDVTPATGITGFEVFDNGSSVTVRSAARHAPDAVRLTLSRSIAAGHAVTLRYLYGMTPNVSRLVRDDSPLALPLENTTDDISVSDLPPQGHSLSGQVRYYSNNAPVAGVTVALEGPATPTSTLTDSNGRFAFAGLPAGNYRIVPRRSGGQANAASPLDAAWTLQDVVRLRTLDANQALACDASGNGAISALDASLILQLAVRLWPSLPAAHACNSDWLFMPAPSRVANAVLTQPVLTRGTCAMGAIDLQALAGDTLNQDFLAMVLGDCTGDWAP